MLAAAIPGNHISNLKFPLLASPKIDGIRCIVKDGIALSRSLKPIPNKYIQNVLGKLPSAYILDGELVVGQPYGNDVMQRTSSGVMSEDGEPEFTYFIFDRIAKEIPYVDRYEQIIDVFGSRVTCLLQTWLFSPCELEEYERKCLEMGYEGIMLRDPKSFYKFGRSTLREGALLKLKRFLDSEAIVIGMEELMHNNNVLEKDELGYAKRSSHKENLTPAGILGALHVKDVNTDVEFHIGTGFDYDTRKYLWENRFEFMKYANIVKYKYFPSGVKDLPRFPVFLGFRDPIDMSKG